MLALVAAAGDLVGGVLATAARWTHERVTALTAVGAGIILGTCFLSLIPEVIEGQPGAPALMAAGFLFVFAAENLFGQRARGSAAEGSHGRAAARELIGALDSEEPLIGRVASWIAFTGLSVHAFFDGVAIAAAWSAGAAAGLVTFFAVMLHKVPEGLSISAIMAAAGRSRRASLLAAAALAALTVGGALLTLLLANLGMGAGVALLALATGTLLYVVSTDLLPVINRTGGPAALVWVFAGVGLVWGALTALAAVGLE